METNKLLTLEEIENHTALKGMLAKETYREDVPEGHNNPRKLTGAGQYMITHYMDSDFDRLLATARAYWELKKKEDKCHVCGEDLMIDVACLRCDADEGTDDKPHPATLKVIVEAVNKILDRHQSGLASLRQDDLAVIAESLEKHLE